MPPDSCPAPPVSAAASPGPAALGPSALPCSSSRGLAGQSRGFVAVLSGAPGPARALPDIAAGAGQVPPAPRAALLELFVCVCLFITQVFLKIIRRGQHPPPHPPSPLALTLVG